MIDSEIAESTKYFCILNVQSGLRIILTGFYLNLKILIFYQKLLYWVLKNVNKIVLLFIIVVVHV